MKTSSEIQEMIRQFPLDASDSPELTASRLLDILDALNKRIDELQARQ